MDEVCGAEIEGSSLHISGWSGWVVHRCSVPMSYDGTDGSETDGCGQCMLTAAGGGVSSGVARASLSKRTG